jgi:hypothetical protein
VKPRVIAFPDSVIRNKAPRLSVLASRLRENNLGHGLLFFSRQKSLSSAQDTHSLCTVAPLMVHH